jgi:mRNA-degrading endonuclease RelE of RelBE toxin-antitoxin system
MPRARHLRIDRLVFAVPVPAGLDLERILRRRRRYRMSNEDRKPIVVTRIPGTRFYRVRDGRHRVIASMGAGRRTVLAVVEDR